MLARDDAPPAALYAAVRAARRAVSAAPDDASAHLLLGQCYLRLLTATRERAWALRLPWLAHLRQSQASAALNRAAALNPRLAQARLELGRLYRRLGYLDLALAELRAYREAGGRDGVTDAELSDLAAVVERRRTELAPEVARARVADRAQAALRRGLAGEARALLLESDVSAFGQEGTRLELELLLRTGRPEDVRNWAAAEVKDALGAIGYHWLRTQALAALGEYAAAAAELTEMAGERGPDPARTAVVFAALRGRALLGEHPAGRGWPAAVSRVVARWQFRDALHDEMAGLAARADAAVMRGLLELEAGEVERARATLRTALDYAAVYGVDFNGRPVAEGALRRMR
jgi:tetratricopeptide (TPR) repeat protein